MQEQQQQQFDDAETKRELAELHLQGVVERSLQTDAEFIENEARSKALVDELTRGTDIGALQVTLHEGQVINSPTAVLVEFTEHCLPRFDSEMLIRYTPNDSFHYEPRLRDNMFVRTLSMSLHIKRVNAEYMHLDMLRNQLNFHGRLLRIQKERPPLRDRRLVLVWQLHLSRICLHCAFDERTSDLHVMLRAFAFVTGIHRKSADEDTAAAAEQLVSLGLF